MIQIRTNDDEFRKVMNELIIRSSRGIAQWTNERMFFLLVRVFALLEPRQVQAKRNQVRTYLDNYVATLDKRTAPTKRTGKKLGKSRIFRRVHLIAQARNAKAGRKGLYGQEMKDAAGKLRRRAIGSVGYLKAGVLKTIKAFNKHFTQFGGERKKRMASGKYQTVTISPNAALLKLQNEYGLDQGNVSNMRGVHSGSRIAKDGFNPVASAYMSMGVANGQEIRVNQRYQEATARAFRDELAEMRVRLQAVLAQAEEEAKKAR